MDRIFYTRTIKGIKSALASMPGELDELYREALVRIQNQAGNDGELGMRILSWVTHAKRPLSVDELRYGLAVEYSDVPEHLEEFDEDNLLSPGSLIDVCAGLVIIDSNSQVVRLVHYTTQEYLDRERMQLFKGVEVDISRACLTYLSYNIGIEVENIEPIREDIREVFYEIIQSHPFSNYACQHWFLHTNNVLLAENPDPRFVKAMTRFKSSDSITISVHLLWLLSYKYSRPWLLQLQDAKKETYPYELASCFGLEDLLHVLLDRRIGVHPNLDSSLVFASYYGHLNVARLLLQNGAAIDAIISLDSRCTLSALEGACDEGHLAVAEFLIENGADIHGRNTALFPPIHAVAMSNNPDIIDLLLKKGVSVNARNYRGETACHTAVMNDRIESTRRLIDANCDLELRDNNGDTVLLACDYHSIPRIIESLLGRGADACAKNKEGKTLRDIIEDRLERPNSVSEDYLKRAERSVEMLRQAEQKSSTTATNDPQQTKSTSSGQSVSDTSTSWESRASWTPRASRTW